MSKPKFVFDTNIFISAVLLEGSINALAIDKAFQTGEIIVSDATFSEFARVLFREKFYKYLTNAGFRRSASWSEIPLHTMLK